MRRKKHSFFPFISIFLLCILLLALLGLRQSASALSLPSILTELLPPKEVASATEAIPNVSVITTTSGTTSDLSDANAVDTCYAYYYQQITSAEKALYQRIYDGVSTRADSIELPTTDTDTVHKIYHFILYDHPELFWCIGSSKSNVYNSKIEFMPDYSCTQDQIASRKAEIEQVAASCLSELSSTASDYEKVRYVYTWLVNTRISTVPWSVMPPCAPVMPKVYSICCQNCPFPASTSPVHCPPAVHTPGIWCSATINGIS